MSAADPKPCFIDDGRGHGLMFQGHGLDPQRIATELTLAFGFSGGERPVGVDEGWFAFTPRVKWCERHHTPCDLNGEWHGHWAPVQQHKTGHPDYAWTFAYFKSRQSEGDDA